MLRKVWDEIGYAFPSTSTVESSEPFKFYYRESSNICRILSGSKIVGHSDIFGASPVVVALTTSSFST